MVPNAHHGRGRLGTQIPEKARNRVGQACVQLGMMPQSLPLVAGVTGIYFGTHVDTTFTQGGCSGARWTKIGQVFH